MDTHLDVFVRGVVVLDGQRFGIEIRSEILFIDAEAWFGDQVAKHRQMADDAEIDGDRDFAAEMRGEAAQIEALLLAGKAITSPGLWPNVYNRALLWPWSLVGVNDAARSYARSLIEFGVSTDAVTDAAFVLAASGDSGELIVTSRLRAQARYARPLGARVVEPSEIQRILEARR